MSLEHIRDRVDGAGFKVQPIRGGRFRCQCPAHGGGGMNMEFRELYPGRIAFTCFSHGCDWHSVIDALGLSREDFYPAHELRQADNGRAYNPTEDEYVVAIARDTQARGERINEKDMDRYRQALARLYGQKGAA